MRPENKDEEKAGKAGVIIITVSFFENTHVPVTIFKGHANFHFSLQVDWLVKDYLRDAMMQLGAVGVGRGCGFEVSQGTG